MEVDASKYHGFLAYEFLIVAPPSEIGPCERGLEEARKYKGASRIIEGIPEDAIVSSDG